MSRGVPGEPLLDAELAAFIQGGVSVVVATRNPDSVPDVARGCGCRVSKDRRRVTVLVEPARAGSALDNVVANGLVAVVFSQPSTHRTIQLKGTDARVVRVTRADRTVALRHLEAWVAELTGMGYRPDFARAVRGAADGMAAIAFTPTSAFHQTPGPGAGERLER